MSRSAPVQARDSAILNMEFCACAEAAASRKASEWPGVPEAAISSVSNPVVLG